MPVYALRPAAWEDLDFLCDLTCAISTRKDRNLEAERQSFIRSYDPTLLQVIRYEGRDVGQLRVAYEQQRLYIGRIQIQPGYQRRGIGAAILIDCIAEARSAGMPVDLEVHVQNNEARRLYKRLGFLIVGWGEFTNKRNVGYYWKMRCLP